MHFLDFTISKSVLTVFALLALLPTHLVAQDTENLVHNGSFEAEALSNKPPHWDIESRKGVEFSIVDEHAAAGASSLLVDSTFVDRFARSMTSSGSQVVVADSIQGKRVRLTASIRTEGLKGPARVQLFVRCAIPGEGIAGAFTPTIRMLDDMADRPVRSSQWQEAEIVVDVPENAASVAVGWKMIGRGRAFLDNFVMEEVSNDVSVTKAAMGASEFSPEMKEYNEKRKLIQTAAAKAHLAPKQPFFSHWLWLAGLSLGLFFMAMYQRDSNPGRRLGTENPPDRTAANASLIWKFAFRFTVAYWVIFIFTLPFEGEFGKLAAWANTYYMPCAEYFIYGLAKNVFDIEETLTPPLGSGDTTYSYLQVLARFLVSLGIATAWSLIDWRKTNYRISQDLLTSYLRYILAAALLVYGLLKVKWSANQFPIIFESRMDQTWGDTSPMRLVWNFMGVSRPYTVFGGLGELIAGLLLVFRRTSIWGAIAAIAVMSNVVMLNFCYDVPVKILSVHLLVIGLMLLVAFSGTLRSLFFLTPTAAYGLTPPYYSATTRWFYFPVKAAIVIVGFAIPCWIHFSNEIDHLSKQAALPKWLNEYSVEEFKVDNQVVTGESHPTLWTDVFLAGANRWSNVSEEETCEILFLKGKRQIAQSGMAPAESEDQYQFSSREHPLVPQGIGGVKVVDDEKISITGETLAGDIEVILKRKNSKKYKLTDRGFRWINEVPFNR